MRRGFTLIELLIVVAIIAILAAIAVPNFLEAQTRSKVSRAHADMRSVATAIESYRVDSTKYPPGQNYYGWNPDALPGFGWADADDWPIQILQQLTTPIAYMTSLPRNPFEFSDPNYVMAGIGPEEFMFVSQWWVDAILMFNPNNPLFPQTSHRWALVCVGPDRQWSAGEYLVFGEATLNSILPAGSPTVFGQWTHGANYDPTNGTVSIGDVIRVGP